MSIAFRAATPHGFTVFLSEGPVISCVKKNRNQKLPKSLVAENAARARVGGHESGRGVAKRSNKKHQHVTIGF
jgi:hypothetical protein